MKKGLRRGNGWGSTGIMNSNRRPDEEGIKTDSTLARAWPDGIPTADLMKKGLRPTTRRASATDLNSNRRPDEEGIKTLLSVVLTDVATFQPQT